MRLNNTDNEEEEKEEKKRRNCQEMAEKQNFGSLHKIVHGVESRPLSAVDECLDLTQTE